MPFDSDSKENSRDLGPWESWRSCYFWPFDRNNGRLMAKEHQSVNSNFTCSLLPWWHVMWEWELVVIQWSLTKFSLCPVSWKASFSVSQVLGMSVQRGPRSASQSQASPCSLGKAGELAHPPSPKSAEGAEQTDRRRAGLEAEEHVGTGAWWLEAARGCHRQQNRLQARGQGSAPEARALGGLCGRGETGPPPRLVTGQGTRRPSHPDVSRELEPPGGRFLNWWVHTRECVMYT